MCMFKNCFEDQERRGLCMRHYCNYKTSIRRGYETWKTLELAGKCLPRAKSKGGKAGRKFKHEISEIAKLYSGPEKIKQYKLHLDRVRERIKNNETIDYLHSILS